MGAGDTQLRSVRKSEAARSCPYWRATRLKAERDVTRRLAQLPSIEYFA